MDGAPVKNKVSFVRQQTVYIEAACCVCVCGPFECDEWAVDIEQRGWAGHGPGGWTKAVTVQKTQCSHSVLIMQDNAYNKADFYNLRFFLMYV